MLIRLLDAGNMIGCGGDLPTNQNSKQSEFSRCKVQKGCVHRVAHAG